MTNPNQEALVRLAALETAFNNFRTGATQRVTKLEQDLANGGQRITGLENAVQPFTDRLTELETAARTIQEAQAEIREKQGILERAAADISARLDTMGRVVRPGRSVIREDVSTIQATLQEILDRLPPKEEAGSGVT